MDFLQTEEFIIRPSNPLDLIQNGNRDVAKRRIEMIPFDRPNFEFISFIDFAKFTQNDYYVSKFLQCNDKSLRIDLFKRKLDSFRTSSENYYFQIEIGQNFKSINVFIKYHMSMFSFSDKESIPCLIFKSNHSQKIFDFQNLYDKPSEDSLLYQVANYYLKLSDKDCPQCITCFFQRLMNPRKTQIDLLFNNRSPRSILEVLDSCPGDIKITYQQKNPDVDKEIQTISIVFPWAVTALKSIHYLEVDGSFDGMKPYVYCVLQGVIFNESVPLAITIAPQECLELYKIFFDSIDEITQKGILWKEMFIISDMHQSIKSVCKSLGITHYFCHRHIIEHFGSSCALGLMVNKLLKCFSFINYINVADEVLRDLDKYEKERLKFGPISDDLKLKIEEVRIMASFEDCDVQSDYYYKNWALWIRREHHVGRCSNHNEALHSVINRTVNAAYGLPKKLTNLIDVVLKHFIYTKRYGKTIKRKIKQYIEVLQKNLNDPRYNILSNCLEYCECEEDKYNNLIYGAAIPCKHKLFSNAKMEIINIKNKLEKVPNNCHFNTFLAAVLSVNHLFSHINIDNASLYLKTLKVSLLEENFALDDIEILNFVTSIQHCFTFNTPKIQNFDLNWNIHSVNEGFSNKYIDFKQNQPIKWFKRIEIPDNIAITTEENQSEAKKKAKRSLYETIYELLTVYPTMSKSSIAYSICFDKYLEYLSFLKDEEIYIWLPAFKIECWKAADLIMKKKRFFK